MMNKKSVLRLFSRILSLILVFLIYVSIFPVPVSTKAANTSSDRVIVGLGDSFSSGEGIEDFFDQKLPIEQKIQSQDWLAHRSTKAWSGLLSFNDPEKKVCYPMNLGKYNESNPTQKANWYFVATSGAETKHICNEKQSVKYYLEENGKIYQKTTSIDKQIDIFQKVSKNNQTVDYVTLTLGGNDVGFTQVISDIAISSYYVTPGYTYTIFMKKLYKLRKDTVGDLKKVYREISKNAGSQASIIVAGYPHLFDPSLNVFSSSESGLLFNLRERLIVNNCVDVLNSHIQSIIKELQKENINIHYVDVTKEFDNHGAYSSTPYINPVYLSPKAQDLDCREFIGVKPNASAYSMHPNEKGAEAYARCVQKKIDELEKRDSSPIAPIETTKPNTTRPNSNTILTTSPGLIPNQNTKNWQTAAVDLICNAPDHGFELADNNVRFELIDITFDNTPEIFISCGMGATRIPSISAYFYYNGSEYVKGTMSGDAGTFPIIPCKNSGQTVFLTSFKAPEDLPVDIPMYASYWYTGVFVSELSCSGNSINFSTIKDYSKHRDELTVLSLDTDEELAYAEEKWEEYCEEVESFYYENPHDSSHYYLVSDYIDLEHFSSEGYKDAVTQDFASGIVEKYSISA